MTVIALACAIPNFLWAITSVKINTSLQAILSLLLIPCTYFLSSLMLKRKFSLWCKLGAIVVIAGALLAASSALFSEGGAEEVGDGKAKKSSDFTRIMCIIIFSFLYLPSAYQYIITEQLFTDGHALWQLDVASGWLFFFFVLMISPLQRVVLIWLGEAPETFSVSSSSCDFPCIHVIILLSILFCILPLPLF